VKKILHRPLQELSAMPVEKKPDKPILKGLRPNSANPPHKVGDYETFETLAYKYGVSVSELLVHNFGSTDPATVNWYLREHVGCKLKTHDGYNWRFSRLAYPGLIYIPKKSPLIAKDPIALENKQQKQRIDQKPLPDPLQTRYFPVDKIKHEWKWPAKDPKEFSNGNWMIQIKVAVEADQFQTGGPLTVELKKDQIKAVLKQKIDNEYLGKLDLELGAGVGEKALIALNKAIETRSKEAFLNVFKEMAEVKFKKKRELDSGKNWDWETELSAEVALMPAVVSTSIDYRDTLLVGGAMLRLQGKIKFSVHIGLTKKGWLTLSKKALGQLKSFATQTGKALTPIYEFLTSEGVLLGSGVAALTVAGTVGIASVVALLAKSAENRGSLVGMSYWYREAYARKIFGGQLLIVKVEGSAELRDALIALGQKDAVSTARAELTAAKNVLANTNERGMLEAYSKLLVNRYGDVASAERETKQAINVKSMQLVGL
jgi:hypothetical protein